MWHSYSNQIQLKMAKQKKESVQLINLDNFKIEQLPELNGKKEEVKSELAKFPAVKIIDNETYELAKKSRTGVKTIRTGLEKEETMVVKKIKENFLGIVIKGYAEIKKDVLAIETEYQAEVTAWEDVKKKEKEARDLAEQQRVDGVKGKINDFVNTWETSFGLIKFDDIQECKEKFEESVAIVNSDKSSLQEFSLLFDKKVEDLRSLFTSKVATLTEQENLRLERIKLDEEKAETKRIQDIKDSINSWYNNWALNIGNLTFSEIPSLRKTFQEEIPLDCQEFQSEFGEKRTQIVSLLTQKIQQLETVETQRIAQEKFLSDKKEFEEKQLKAKNELRREELKSLGFVVEDFADNGPAFYNKELNLCYSLLILNNPDENWDALIQELKTVAENILKEEISEIQQPSDSYEAKQLLETFEEKEKFGMDLTSKIEETDVLLISETDNRQPATKLKDSDFVMVPKQLITDTPNDSKLGSIVRKMANE